MFRKSHRVGEGHHQGHRAPTGGEAQETIPSNVGATDHLEPIRMTPICRHTRGTKLLDKGVGHEESGENESVPGFRRVVEEGSIRCCRSIPTHTASEAEDPAYRRGRPWTRSSSSRGGSPGLVVADAIEVPLAAHEHVLAVERRGGLEPLHRADRIGMLHHRVDAVDRHLLVGPARLDDDAGAPVVRQVNVSSRQGYRTGSL